MTINTLAELIDLGWKMEAESFGEEAGLAHFIIQAEDGSLSVIATDMGDDKQKQILRLFVANQLRQTNAKRYVLVSEAWVATMAKDDPDMGQIAPSEHPRRTEQLFALGVERGGGNHFRFAKIVRNDAGKRVLDEVHDNTTDSQGGSMAELFQLAADMEASGFPILDGSIAQR